MAELGVVDLGANDLEEPTASRSLRLTEEVERDSLEEQTGTADLDSRSDDSVGVLAVLKLAPDEALRQSEQCAK